MATYVPSPETLAGINRGASGMASHATALVEAQHAWFSQLSAEDRSWIGVIAHGGITSFINWLQEASSDHAAAVDIFADAPRELTRSITLEHTLDLIRTVIQVVEDEAPGLSRPDEQEAVRNAVLHYSREVAFAAAHVYARAAESRGAWDARLESLVVDAVLRGEPDDSLGSRVNALGWAHVQGVSVIVGVAPLGDEHSVVDPLRRAARHADLELLVSIEGRRLIVIVGGIQDSPVDAAKVLAEHFGSDAIVCGPLVPHLYAAGRSARDALRGFDAAAAAPWLPRPTHSDDLIAARAVAGDDKARKTLIQRVAPLLPDDSSLGQTARSYLRQTSLEASARELFVHVNTVRYRLGRIHEVTGFDPTTPDDSFTLRLALMLGDLEASAQPQRTRKNQVL